MKRTVKKAIQTGYGLGLLTLEQAKKVAAKSKEELDLDDEESRQLAQELVNSSRKASKEVLDVVSKNMEAAIVRSGLAKRSELRSLKKRIRTRLGRKLGMKKKKSIFHHVHRHVKKMMRRKRK